MVGKRMKKARLARGYSAEQVAEHLGISPATVYRYENGSIGKIPIKHAMPLAQFLNVAPGYLMGFDVDMEPGKKVHETEQDCPPSSIVVPNNEMFVKAYDVMSDEDRMTLLEIFNRAYRKLNGDNPDEPFEL